MTRKNTGPSFSTIPRQNTDNDPARGVDLSVVIPLLNEEESLELLYTRVTEVLLSLDKTYEIIFVDDGGTDGSFAILEELHRKDNNIKVIQFRRNFGKSAALAAGFSEAEGGIIVTMDADLQDDPREIPRFLSKIEEGYDLVSGWKFPRRDPLSKTIPSKLFNLATRVVTGLKLHDSNCGFKAYRSEVVRQLEIYGGLHRYIAALAHWRGFRVGEIEVQHHPRQFGESKFGLARFSKGFFDLITALFLTQYVRRPLHLFGWFGVFSLAGGMLINIYLAVLWFTGHRPIGDRPLLMLGVLLVILGGQFFSFGLLAEMVTNILSSTTDDYSIRRKLL